MKKYKLIDTWNVESAQYKTENEIFEIAYELYCGNPTDKELQEAKQKINTLNKAAEYIEQQCGWRIIRD